MFYQGFKNQPWQSAAWPLSFHVSRACRRSQHLEPAHFSL